MAVMTAMNLQVRGTRNHLGDFPAFQTTLLEPFLLSNLSVVRSEGMLLLWLDTQ